MHPRYSERTVGRTSDTRPNALLVGQGESVGLGAASVTL
jgi:hypothetical protein